MQPCTDLARLDTRSYAMWAGPVAYRYIKLNFHYYHDAYLGWYWGGTDPGCIGLAMWKTAP